MRRLKVFAAGSLILFLLCAITFVIVFWGEKNVAQGEIQNFEKLAMDLQVKPSEIVASDGTLLYQVSTELREYAPLSEIPPRVRNAMIAAEDRRFYHHPGVDVWALGRILVADVSSRKLSQGGSTLTMQLAKLVTTKGEKTYQRKIHDMALAMDLEESMSKDRILELYLNKVSFGSHALGIKAAADVYFGKPLDKLTVGEAAFLARLVRRPSSWNNLLRDEDLQNAAIDNRNTVLKIMREENMITEGEFKTALAEVPKFNRKPPKSSDRLLRAPYFVTHVIDVFHREFPEVRLSDGGYRIETTLDPQMEALAEKEVEKTVEKNRKNKVSTAAFVLMNSSGQILAEVGGVSFDKNQYNMIYQGRRQPGSSFKPYVYATALNAGVVHIDDQLANMGPFTFPAPFGGEAWTVHNSDGKYSATTPLRYAFALSKNVPAAHVIAKVGPAEVVRTAHEAFGFKSKLEPVLPLVLGSDAVNPLEVAQALSVFVLRGDRATPYAITRVIGPNGDVIKEYGPRIDHNVFNPAVCDQIDQLMRGVVQFGTGYKANVVPDARGKTGTTNSNRDAWFVGYSDGLIGVGWIANEQPPKNGVVHYEPMGRTVFGGTVTVEFWAAVMKAAHEKYGTKFVVAPKLEEKPGKAQAPPLPKDVTPTPPDDQKKMGPASDDNAVPVAVTKGPPPEAPDPAGLGDEPADADDQDADPPTPKPVDKPPVEQFVEVEVCADTGMCASVYCPETVTRRFKKGTEPKKVCTRHTG